MFCRRPVLVLLFFILALTAQGQIMQPDRVEFEIKEGNYEVVPAGKDGLFVLHNTFDINSGDQVWTVSKLDTAFNKEWESVYVDVTTQFLYSKYNDKGTLYLLFSRNETKKNKGDSTGHMRISNNHN